MKLASAYQTPFRFQAATFEDNPSLHPVGGFQGTMNRKNE